MERAARGYAVEELLTERPLVRADRGPAGRLDVFDRRHEAGEQLVCERSRLEAVTERLQARGTHLVRPPRLEQLGAPVCETQVRAEELIRRADEHVDAQVGHVDRPVGCVVHGVRPRESAGVMRELHDSLRVRQRSDRVRRKWKRDDARPVRELTLEIAVVERRVVCDVDEADLHVQVVCELEPRRDVAVVVELRDEDLVARPKGSADGARQREVERRHVRSEDRLVRLAAKERRRRQAGLRHERVAAAARAERPAEIRVRLAQVARDRVDDRVGDLRAPGPVEERGGPAQRGEARANGVDVEGERAHPTDAS